MDGRKGGGERRDRVRIEHCQTSKINSFKGKKFKGHLTLSLNIVSSNSTRARARAQSTYLLSCQIPGRYRLAFYSLECCPRRDGCSAPRCLALTFSRWPVRSRSAENGAAGQEGRESREKED